jgi:hypothetical protein
MATVTRWIATTALAAGLGMATLTAPVPAHAREGDDLARVIVDVADVIYRSGYPYYRHGNYGYDDRLLVERDRYGRPIYYRTFVRSGPPYGKAHGYWKKQSQASRLQCDRHGRCVTRYYDPRYDRRHDNRYYSYERNRYDRYDRVGRYWDGRRWRGHDDD